MQANAAHVCVLTFQRTRLRLGTHGRFPLVCRRDTCEAPLLPRPGRVLSGRRGRRGGSDLGIRLLEQRCVEELKKEVMADCKGQRSYEKDEEAADRGCEKHIALFPYHVEDEE